MAAPQIEGLFVGINRSGQAVDKLCLKDETCWVAMAAYHSVGLFHYNENRIHGLHRTLLPCHTDRINGIRFIRKRNQVVGLISVSADKTAHVWRPLSNFSEWRHVATLKGHTLGITCVGVLQDGPYHVASTLDWIVTGSDDGTLRVWTLQPQDNDEEQAVCIQVITTGPHMPLAITLGYLPHSLTPFIITGSTNNQLELYVCLNESYSKTATLPGHTDWIRSISIAYSSPRELVIASASQDKFIRLWKLSAVEPQQEPNTPNDILNAFIKSESDYVQLSTKAFEFHVPLPTNQTYSIMLDAILMGHDDWIHSVEWEESIQKASADKSIMMWQPDRQSGVWMNVARMGEVGGTTLGYYQALLLNTNTIMGLGYNGAIHIWTRQCRDNQLLWISQVGLSGHTASVRDIQWDPTGSFLVSVSLDETARLFAPWKRSNQTTWHELFRPQIHGYPLQCLAFIHKYGYASGADEKIVRIFEAPLPFVESLHRVTGVEAGAEDRASRPTGAILPALGLSNKAVNPLSTHDHDDANESTMSAVISNLAQPPVEGHLLQHTLWPEVHKLYGHGYELKSVACSSDGRLLASAARATKAEDASIRLWCTRSFKQVCDPLEAHTLTVTRLCFSHDNSYLLSAGRDRAWALFNRQNDEWRLIRVHEKAHARIIWDVSWTWDDHYFASGSRDKTVKIWRKSGLDLVSSYTFDHSVTAIHFTPKSVGVEYVLAVGLETGQIIILRFQITESNALSVSHRLNIPSAACPCLSVNRLAWNQHHLLAACSDDHSVRIFNCL